MSDATTSRTEFLKTMAFDAQAAHLDALGQKQIPGTMIFGRFVTCLGLPPNIDLHQSISDRIVGDLVPWDLGLQLMRYQPFKGDGLLLQKYDCMQADTFADLCNLVFHWYRSHGWTVT
jgi:hypothetical protein